MCARSQQALLSADTIYLDLINFLIDEEENEKYIIVSIISYGIRLL